MSIQLWPLSVIPKQRKHLNRATTRKDNSTFVEKEKTITMIGQKNEQIKQTNSKTN